MLDAVRRACTPDLRFPGHWFQIEAGLAYNWYRHYGRDQRTVY
jgi:hypothetical protein